MLRKILPAQAPRILQSHPKFSIHLGSEAVLGEAGRARTDDDQIMSLGL